MGNFTESLEALQMREPKMKRACLNILNDARTGANPYGISEELQESLEREYNPAPDIRPELEKAINKNRSIDKPAMHVPAQIDSDELRRVTSLTTFKKHNLANRRASTYISTAGAHIMRDEIAEAVERAGKESRKQTIKIDPIKLGGESGKDDRPSWWHWLEDEPPETGLIYMKELGLPQKERRRAQASGVTVELIFKKNDLANVAFFRPTGLDAFSENTPFCVNNGKEEAFGRTCPTRPMKKGRPEAVSRSIKYDDLLDDADIEVVLYPF